MKPRIKTVLIISTVLMRGFVIFFSTGFIYRCDVIQFNFSNCGLDF